MSWEVDNFDAFNGVDETPNKATSVQVSIIEGLLIRASISEQEKEDIERYLKHMDEKEAYETINYLKENEVETDPAKRYKQFK